MIRVFSLLFASLVLAACRLGDTSPKTDLEGLPEGLEVELTVEPAEVRQHGAFTLRLRLRNTTAEPIHISTGSSCLALPYVKRGENEVPFRGTDQFCMAVVTTHVFEPGEVYDQTWSLHATLYAQKPGDTEGAPAPKGTYVVGLKFDGSTVPGSIPVIERPLRVR